MKRINLLMLVVMAFAALLSACTPAATLQPTAAATQTAAATATVAATPTAAATATTAATATAAATQAAAAGPITLKDDSGNEVKLDKPAQKIISLAPSNTEILFALGADKQVVAREDFSNFPDAAKALPSIGGSSGKYNMEQIAKLQPDLILASPLTAADAIKALQAITPNIYVVPNPKDLAGLYANFANVGLLTGHTSEADALTKDFKTRAQAVQDKVALAKDKPKIFYELDGTDPAKPWTSGPGTFIDTLISMAGGQNVGNVLKGDFAQISQEELIVQNPDIILLGDALYGNIKPDQVMARPGWNAINAVKNKQVLEFNDDLVSRPGPRLIDGLEALAKIIHPDLFK